MARRAKRQKRGKPDESEEDENEMKEILREIEEEKENEEEPIPRKQKEKEDENETKEMRELKRRIGKMEESFKAWKEFLEETVTGGKPFFYQVKIEEAMLRQNTIKEWGNKQIRDIARDLASVQNKLHTEREFPAARELHGLIEMVEVTKEITSVNPSALPWMKKAVDDAIEVALRQGTDQRGQAVFWGCLTKHLADHMADGERQWAQQRRQTTGSTTTTTTSLIPCQNCVKNGVQGQFHTLGECAKRKNVCKMECRNCPQDPETHTFPCHWREQCPNLRNKENRPYRNMPYSRAAY